MKTDNEKILIALKWVLITSLIFLIYISAVNTYNDIKQRVDNIEVINKD